MYIQQRTQLFVDFEILTVFIVSGTELIKYLSEVHD